MIRRMFRAIGAFCFTAVLAVASMPVLATQAPDQVSQLLSQMSAAVREKNYRGLFTYEHGGTLQTFRVTHRVVDGVEEEVLENLNGPSRRVERKGTPLSCLSPSDRVLRGMLPTLDGSYNGLSQHYHFYVRHQERIAGRLATLLQVVPRDEYRHGYTLAIDTESSIPLMAITVSSGRKVLERMQFASLELEENDSWAAVTDTSVSQSVQVQSMSCDDSEKTLPQWNITWMPSGFIASGSSRKTDAGDVMQFTDGLANFSVFVQPFEEKVSAQGSVQRGSTVAHMQQHVFKGAAYTVTVVGELPVQAAQRIADSVRAADVEPEVASPAEGSLINNAEGSLPNKAEGSLKDSVEDS